MNQYLLVGGEAAKTKVLLHAIGSKDEGGGEVSGLGEVAGHVGALNHALLAGHSLHTQRDSVNNIGFNLPL